MTTMSIAVPAKMKKEVESRVKAGGYGNVSEYMRELIRTDPTIRQAYIEARLLEGVRSGPAVEADEAFWARLRNLSKAAAANARKKP
jgi:antitoxin ParD1/3/4